MTATGGPVAGTLVAGRYRLERRLGEGGMGAVWGALEVDSGAAVALKFIRGDDESGGRLKRMSREARAARAVKHPNVVTLHDVIELVDGSPVIVMELLDGESLAERFDREAPLPAEQMAAIAMPVVSAVRAAHALGIVHRDLKPENVFLARGPGDRLDVKVLNFGIAKLTALDGDAARTTGATATGALVGTPCYMAPEQAFGERDVDHRADVWSIGMILYEGLSGVLPTQAENVGQVLKIVLTHAIRPLGAVAPQVPDGLRDLVDRMLAHDREDRPADLGEVADALAPYAGAATTVRAPPRKAPGTGVEHAGSKTDGGAVSIPGHPSPRTRSFVTAVVAVAAVTGAAAWSWMRVRAEAPADTTAAAQTPPAVSAVPEAPPPLPVAPDPAPREASSAAAEPSSLPSGAPAAPSAPRVARRNEDRFGHPIASATGAPFAPTPSTTASGRRRLDPSSLQGAVVDDPPF